MGIFQEPLLGHDPDNVNTSNSEIQTFKGCRRQWLLGYYLALQPKKELFIGPLKLGTRIHDALEQYYVTGEHPSTAYQRLQRLDNRKFLETDDAQWEDKVDKFNKESELGRIMVEGYKEWADESNIDAGLIIVEAEKVVKHKVDEVPGITLVGKLDLLARRPLDGSRCVVDHKSAISFTPFYEYAHMSEQLMTYTVLESFQEDDDTPLDGGMYNLLKKVKRTATAKPPFYDRLDVRFGKKTLASFWIRTVGTLMDMRRVREQLDAGVDHRLVAYPKPMMDWHCGKCPFFALCPMLDDGSSAEQMIEDMYVQTNPNARYNSESSEEII